MLEDKLCQWLETTLTQDRLQHSYNVAHMAAELAEIYNANVCNAYWAGLLHDCAKDLGNQVLLKHALAFDIMESDIQSLVPDLLHAPVGAFLVAQKLPDANADMLAAIRYHITGRPKMSALEQIIYVADIIEPGRCFPGVLELRELVGQPLPLLTLAVMDHVLQHLIKEGMPIDVRTIFARNELLASTKVGGEDDHAS